MTGYDPDEDLFLLWSWCVKCGGTFYSVADHDCPGASLPIVPGMCGKCVPKNFWGLSPVDDLWKQLGADE